MASRIVLIILGGVMAGLGTALHSWAGAVLVASGVVVAACAAGER